MSDELRFLQQLLQKGLAASMQGSYQRRLPDKASLPEIHAARKSLKQLVVREPSAEAWRSLALAEEALLHYPAAIRALQQAISLSEVTDRRDLKRLAALREYGAQWEVLGLTPERLDELGIHLEQRLDCEPCDGTSRHTLAWLSSQSIKSPAKVLKALEKVGGCCDCEILANAI